MTQNQEKIVHALENGEKVKVKNSRGYEAILERVQGKYEVIMNANGVIEEGAFDKPISAVVFAGIQ